MIHWNSRARTSIEIVTFSIAFSIVEIVAVEYELIEIVTKIATSQISPLRVVGGRLARQEVGAAHSSIIQIRLLIPHRIIPLRRSQ